MYLFHAAPQKRQGATMPNQLIRLILLGIMMSLCGMLMAGCGGNAAASAANIGASHAGMATSTAPAAPATVDAVVPKPDQVMIENFSFVPPVLTVKVGTAVTWINHDDVPHTVTGADNRFGSPALDTGDNFAFHFTTPGTYSYYCAIHPQMTAKVVVR
jgi:plastocyanin